VLIAAWLLLLLMLAPAPPPAVLQVLDRWVGHTAIS
jgi:hypothetical protein